MSNEQTNPDDPTTPATFGEIFAWVTINGAALLLVVAAFDALLQAVGL